MSKIDTGKEGTNIPDDFNIPSCGLEDVDRAVFSLFEKRLQLEVKIDGQATKVPVVFAAGERFALTRRRKPIRDRNNALILPLISISRKSIDHSPNLGGYGTAISPRDQDFYVVRRRLDKSDRDYQNIINKRRIKNQDNVANRANFGDNTNFPGNIAKPDTFATRRNGNNLSFLSDDTGYLLKNDIDDNIFEIITIPYPEFFLSEYEITFWTQYMQESNQMIETLMASFDGQGHEFLVHTDKGYEFVAYVANTFSAQDNFEDFSNDERIIKYSFSMKVPAYLIAPQHPGTSSPFRRFVSAPHIEFGIYQTTVPISTPGEFDSNKDNVNKFILSDVEVLNSRGEQPLARGQDGARALEVMEDPFSGETTKRYVKVLTTNQRAGETVASARSRVKLEDPTDEASSLRAPKIETQFS